MRDADVAGALSYRAVKNFGCGAVRVFLEKMMLDFPHVVEADSVRQFDLRERLPVDVVFAERVPGPWSFHFIQQPELHSVFSFARQPRLARFSMRFEFTDANCLASARTA